MRGEQLFHPIPRSVRYADRNTVVFHGKEVPVVDLCREYGISDATLRYRYKQGWSDDKLVEKPKHKPVIKMEYEGKMYSISELCKNFGFKETTLRRRHARGLDFYGNKIAG